MVWYGMNEMQIVIGTGELRKLAYQGVCCEQLLLKDEDEIYLPRILILPYSK